MKLADAPPPGWYPDPRRPEHLRWWDGSDWTARRRTPPPTRFGAAALLGDESDADPASDPAMRSFRSDAGALTRRDAEEMIAEVRKVARSEVERAADVLSQRAEDAARRIQPLITQYTNRVLRIIRIGALIAVSLVVAWILFQVFVQASFFQWLGDRIDRFSDN
ncbi:MAG: DUF2510 domain-containing protein [Acidimicrobiales bacterium]